MKHRRTFSGFLLCLAAMSVVSACAGKSSQSRATGPSSAQAPPSTVIWWYTVTRPSLESLRTALSSGLVTHALIKGMHRYDMHLSDRRITDAVAVVREFKDVKLIWSRNTWPYTRIRDVTARALTDPEYYEREIRELKKESKTLRADFTALDTEPYGDAPVKPVLRGKNIDYARLWPRLSEAVRKATEKAGQVDYVYPSGTRAKQHPYIALAGLGKQRLAEITYYDNPYVFRTINFPYDIPGFYVNTHREREGRPASPFFRLEQVFLRRELWESKDAIWIYQAGELPELARELVEYARKIGIKEPR